MKVFKKLKIFMNAMFLRCGKVDTDKGSLFWDNDQILRVGDLVYKEVRDDDGEPDYVKADDGEYRADDGRRIIVEDGVVREIEQGSEPDADHVDAAAIDEPVDKPADAPDDDDKPDERDEERIQRLEDAIALHAKAMEELNNRMANIEEENKDLKERLAKLEFAPATNPADGKDETNVDAAAERRAALAAIRRKSIDK